MMLSEVIEYSETSPSGLRWKINASTRARVGSVAGNIKSGRYYQFCYKGKCYICHRVVWELFHGHPGKFLVDHKDGDIYNNSIGNLRLATSSQNTANSRKTKSKTTSSFKGVCRKKGGWYAYIQLDGKNKHLGIFQEEEDAARAYDKEAKVLFGEFAGGLNFG